MSSKFVPPSIEERARFCRSLPSAHFGRLCSRLRPFPDHRSVARPASATSYPAIGGTPSPTRSESSRSASSTGQSHKIPPPHWCPLRTSDRSAYTRPIKKRSSQQSVLLHPIPEQRADCTRLIKTSMSSQPFHPAAIPEQTRMHTSHQKLCALTAPSPIHEQHSDYRKHSVNQQKEEDRLIHQPVESCLFGNTL